MRAYAKQFTITDKETGEDREGRETDNFPRNLDAGAPDLSLMAKARAGFHGPYGPVSYTHLRAHETVLDLVCRLLLEKKKT